MASIRVTDNFVDIRFTAWERFWIGRKRLTIPFAAVRQASSVAEPLRLASGARRGIVVSGLLKIGAWVSFGGRRQLVAARRGEPGLHLVLDRSATEETFDEIVLSDPAGAGLADAITRARAAHA